MFRKISKKMKRKASMAGMVAGAAVLYAAAAFCSTLAAGPVPAFANSAQSHFSGVSATGAMPADAESPIVIEKELLTLELGSFPSNHYRSAEQFLAYDGKVTAQYTFYNPSEYTVTSKLLFPFGRLPDYADSYYDEAGNPVAPDDTAKYEILVDGEKAPTRIRHTLSYEYEQFDVQRDLGAVHDDFVSDSFFSPNLPVTEYCYKVSGVDFQSYQAVTVAFDVPDLNGKTVLYFPQNNSGRRLSDGTMRYGADAATSVSLYVIGEPFVPAWKFYENGAMNDREQIAGSMALKETRTMTFGELVLGWRDEAGAVSEVDWYNAAVAEFRRACDRDASVFTLPYTGHNLYRALMRWYEYEIVFAPGARVINSVTAPLYPYIDLSWTPAVYNYTYFLSPAKTWKSFGELKIEINTPYFLIQSSLEGFTKTENGYTMSASSLPESELQFTLSTAEAPDGPDWTDSLSALFNTFPFGIIMVAVPVILVLACVIAVIVAVRKRKHKKP